MTVMAILLLIRTCENVIEIVVEEEKAMGMKLVRKKLATRIACHGEAYRVGPC
jgi:hypothetical protein